MKKFIDRKDAGRQLAQSLQSYQNNPNVIVLGLPRGGVPVAFEIANALHTPLDVFIVKKLGVPGYEEIAMGAISTDDNLVLNDQVIQNFHISQTAINQAVAEKKKEVLAANALFRQNKAQRKLDGKIVILVDDGIATGATIKVAVKALQQLHPKEIIIATPVIPRELYQDIKSLTNELVALLIPDDFIAVGNWYNDFSQTSNQEVLKLLAPP